MNKDYSNKEYQDYVKKKSPKSNTVKDTFMAFVVGGLICMFAERIANLISSSKISKETVRLA